MNHNLLFDFQVNKNNNTINIKKEFNADLTLIWDVYTKSELLDQWWAPKPWMNKTKSMDFREGGMWHYAMVNPQGQTNWCRLDYLTITIQKTFSALDAFCDEEGKWNEQFARTKWEIKFIESENKTLVDSLLSFDSLIVLETVLDYGFKEGATAGINQLEALIETLKK